MFPVVLLAAAVAAQAPQAPSRPVIEQATATVRIVSGERISAAQLPRDALITDAAIKGADGQVRTVRLVEFP